MRRLDPWRGGLALTAVAGVLACGGDDGTEPPFAATVNVSPSSAQLAALGDTVQLAATVLDQNGQLISGAPVTWASNDNSVATVGTTGLVTAIGNGTATATATSGTASGAASVSVAQLPVGMDLSPVADTLFALGDTLRLTARPWDANDNPIADASVYWSSADQTVATVDASGLVTATGTGTANISATVGSTSATARLTVVQLPARVEVVPDTDTLLALGDTVRLAGQPLDANDNPIADIGVVWNSADDAVATVDSTGLVTATGNGTVDIAATVGDAAGAATVTVSQLPVAMDVVPSSAALLALGDTVRLVATGFDPNGHAVAGLTFAWTSENGAFATVDPHGLVTAVRTGSTNIYATAGELRDSAGVTVAQLATEVRVTPAVDTLNAVGDTVRLTAVALDRNGNEVEDTDYIWYSPHPTVVTVDDNGLVTARGAGTGEIRVRATRAGANYVGVATITVREGARGRLPSRGVDRRTDPSR